MSPFASSFLDQRRRHDRCDDQGGGDDEVPRRAAFGSVTPERGGQGWRGRLAPVRLRCYFNPKFALSLVPS